MNEPIEVNTPPSSGRGARQLTTKQFFGYGAGDTANNLAFSLAISFLPIYYTDVALISPGIVGAIFLTMRFVDAITDVLLGTVVDRTNTRWGKFRPYILFASVPLVILAVLAFSIPSAFHATNWAVVWAVVTYFLMGSVAFTLVNIPYGSLAAAMTDNSQERSKLAVSRSIGAALMQVTVAVAISPALEANRGDPDALQSALTRTVGALGIVAILLYLFLFLTSRENVERSIPQVGFKDSLRTLGQNRALQALGGISVIYLTGLFGGIGILAYYTRDVMGDARYLGLFATILYGMVLIVGWFIPPLAAKFGKPRVFQIGGFLGALGALILWRVPSDLIVVAVIAVVFIGISSGLVNTLMWNMEADAVEYGEWKTGLRSEGTTYAIFSFVRKMAQALGGAVGIWIIGWFGYQGGQVVQSESAIEGIRLAMGLLPAVVFALAAVLMQFYPLTDDRHRQILLDLRSRKETGIMPQAMRDEQGRARAADPSAQSSNAEGSAAQDPGAGTEPPRGK